MFKTTMRINHELAEWFTTQATVSAEIVELADEAVKVSMEGREIELVAHEANGLVGDISVEAEALKPIIPCLEVGQSVRIGSGQWTFYAEPDEKRLIFSQTEEFA